MPHQTTPKVISLNVSHFPLLVYEKKPMLNVGNAMQKNKFNYIINIYFNIFKKLG
jgi:hypothetical protein